MINRAPLVYRDLDQAQLDREYDLRTAAPDHEAWQAIRTERGERARRALDCSLDVRYGTSPRQALDIFPARGADGAGRDAAVRKGGASGRPATAGRPVDLAPVEIYIHGGAWRAKSKDDVSFIAEALVPAGVTFVAIDHDRAGDVTLDEVVAQVRAAVAWVYRNIADWSGDPDRIHVSGHSSGAHLGAMALATPWPEAFGLPTDVIKGACLTSGLYDLEPVRLGSRNEHLALDQAAVERLSPIRHIPTGRAAPHLLLSVGGRETREFLRQTEGYRQAWLAAGQRVTFVEMPDDHHYSLAVRPGEPGNPLFEATLAAIRRPPRTGGSLA